MSNPSTTAAHLVPRRPTMTHFKAVVFDHGGVLTRGGEKGTNETAASRAMGLAEPIVIPDLNEALKCGRIGNREYVQQINQRFPDAPRRLTDAMWDDIYARLRPDPDAYAFADRCREAGLRTSILTSINPAMAACLQTDGSYDGFDPVIMSCYVGCAKPDPKIYQLVEQQLAGIDPSEILFLDDQEKCCAGARQRGWHAIRVDSTEQMIREASDLLGMTVPGASVIDAAYLGRQRAFSERTFGPGTRTETVLDHIRRELVEIEAAPRDLGEWVDVVILALDGAWRAGYRPQEIIDGIVAKQARNEKRVWPDWRTAPAGRAIEHDRTAEETVGA